MPTRTEQVRTIISMYIQRDGSSRDRRNEHE
jgi:hypothetical protein